MYVEFCSPFKIIFFWKTQSMPFISALCLSSIKIKKNLALISVLLLNELCQKHKSYEDAVIPLLILWILVIKWTNTLLKNAIWRVSNFCFSWSLLKKVLLLVSVFLEIYSTTNFRWLILLYLSVFILVNKNKSSCIFLNEVFRLWCI